MTVSLSTRVTMPRIRLRADSSATTPTGAGRAISWATAARSAPSTTSRPASSWWLGRRPASTIRRTVSSETPSRAAASEIRICVSEDTRIGPHLRGGSGTLAGRGRPRPRSASGVPSGQAGAAARPRGRGSARGGVAWRRRRPRGLAPQPALHPGRGVRAGPLGMAAQLLARGPRSAGGSGVVQSARSVSWPRAVSAASATRRWPSLVRWMRSSAHIRQSRRAAMPQRLSTWQPCRCAMVKMLAVCTACRPRRRLKSPASRVSVGVASRTSAPAADAHHGLLEAVARGGRGPTLGRSRSLPPPTIETRSGVIDRAASSCGPTTSSSLRPRTARLA